MDRQMLSDTQWNRIQDFLPGKPTDKGGRAGHGGPRAVPSGRTAAITPASTKCPPQWEQHNAARWSIRLTKSATVWGTG